LSYFDRCLYKFILVRCIPVSPLFGCVDDVSSVECDVNSLVAVVNEDVVEVAVVEVVGIRSIVPTTIHVCQYLTKGLPLYLRHTICNTGTYRSLGGSELRKTC